MVNCSYLRQRVFFFARIFRTEKTHPYSPQGALQLLWVSGHNDSGGLPAQKDRGGWREAKKFRKTGGAVMRVKITLACTECKQRNYNTMKNKKNDPDRLEMSKYCRFCKKHTTHKETK